MAKKRKTRMPVQKRGIETRSKIIDAAMDLFGSKGYHSTNAIEIAARAGIGTGTFYGYFNNKKEVLAEGIRRFYKEATKTMVNASSVRTFDPENSREFVRFMIQSLIAAHDVAPGLHKNISAMILLDEDIEDLCAEEDMKAVALIEIYLEANKDMLRINDYHAAAVVILRVSDEIVHRVKFFKQTINEERLINELEDMVHKYLLKDRYERIT